MPDSDFKKAAKKIAKEQGRATDYPIVGRAPGHFKRGLALLGSLITETNLVGTERKNLKAIEEGTKKARKQAGR